MTHTKPESASRRSRLTRAADTKRFPLDAIEQAVPILHDLDLFLFLTNDQIELMRFRTGATATGKPRSPKGAAYAANTALRRLFDSGYLDRVPVFLPDRRCKTVKPHYVNVLSRSGAAVTGRLHREAGMTPRWRRSLLPHPWQPILHGFWLREVAVAARVACREAGWRWWSWFDDRRLAGLKKTHGARYRTVPDGFFVITNPNVTKDFPHFLEIDLGTETVSARSSERADWRGKVESYLDYFDRDFREQFGLSTLPIVLTVTGSERRLEHLLAATAASGGAGRFWFTTLARLLFPTSIHCGANFDPPNGLQGPFWAPIWRVPGSSQVRSLADRCGAYGRSQVDLPKPIDIHVKGGEADGSP
jgi:hypothetical protein